MLWRDSTLYGTRTHGKVSVSSWPAAALSAAQPRRSAEAGSSYIPSFRDTETESSEAEAPAAAPQAADEPGPQAKAAAFDPLGRRGKGKQPAAPGTKSSDRGDPNPEDMEAISMGISKLLAELAGGERHVANVLPLFCNQSTSTLFT